MEPETDIKRKILEVKRDKFRAEGYEWAVNAELARKLGEGDGSAAEGNSRRAYRAAKEMQALLDALPKDDDGDPA